MTLAKHTSIGKFRVATLWPQLFIVLVLVFYTWMTWVCAPRKHKVVSPANAGIAALVRADMYNLQAQGFLKGHLYLDLEAPRELVTAPNPYDPAQRPKVQYLHDSSFYQGHYYSYFGPAPALLLFVPVIAVTGQELPSAYGVLVFVCLGFLAQVLLLNSVLRHHLPSTSSLCRWTCLVALGFCSLYIPLLRRPSVYEVAISSGSALFFWGLYMAWHTSQAKPKAVYLFSTLAGTCLGLSIASRPTFILGSPALFLLLCLPVLAPVQVPPTTPRLRLLLRQGLPAFLACTLIVSCLLGYNFLRFGSFLEFGQKYQLSAAYEGEIRHFNTAFLRPQSWFYLFEPLGHDAWFPFLRHHPLIDKPTGFGEREHSFGLLVNLPLYLLAFLGAGYAFLRRQHPSTPILRILTLLCITSLLPLLLFFGSCVRYMAEFGPPLLLLACLGLCRLEYSLQAQASAESLRKWTPRLALGLASLSAVVLFLACVDMYDSSPYRHPQGFDSLATLANRPVRWLHNRIPGAPKFEEGPLHVRLQQTQAGLDDRIELFRGGDQAGNEESVTLELQAGMATLVAERKGTAPYLHRRPLALEHGRIQQLDISVPSMYPLRHTELSHPLPADEFRLCRNWLLVRLDGHSVAEIPLRRILWRCLETKTASPSPGDGKLAIRLLQVTRSPPSKPDISCREIDGVSLRFTLPATPGRLALPLACSGFDGEGNLLFLQTDGEGRARVGYDRWGKAAAFSPIFDLRSNGAHELRFWMPSLDENARQRPLLVLLDGRPIWKLPLPYYPADPRERFLLSNPLGGSSCDARFPGAELLDCRLPWPTDIPVGTP